MDLSLNVKLYNVEGISHIDTPYFSDLSSQEDYFESKLVKGIVTSYFPPFFTDSITFDDTDLKIDTNVNYLSVYYSGKTFYYFINEISYTNSGCISLGIEMDTIQTFMFNFKVKNGIIERKFINRWNTDGTINRNYIRESATNGLFKVDSYTELSTQGVFIAKTSSKLTGQESVGSEESDRMGTTLHDLTKDIYYPSSLNVYVLPAVGRYVASAQNYNHFFGYYSCYHFNTSTSLYEHVYRTFDITEELQDINSSSMIYQFFYLPFIPVEGMSYGTYVPGNGDDNVYPSFIVDNNDTKVSGSFNHITKHIIDTNYLFRLYKGDIFYHTDNFIITLDSNSFIKDTYVNSVFNKRFFPNLIDENYIKLMFGERNCYTSYPLSRLPNASCTYYYWADITSGNRFYKITKDNTGVDEYITTITSSSPIDIDLITDYYKDYLSRNKYTMLAAVGSDTVKAIKSFASAGMSNYGIAMDLNAMYDAKSSYDKRYKLPTLKKGNKLYESKEKLSMAENSLSAVSTGSSTVDELVNRANISYTPDTVKSVGTFITDALSTSYKLFISTQVVDDIEQVANYYHRNGYLVNEYYKSIIRKSYTKYDQGTFTSQGVCTHTFTILIDPEETYENGRISLSSNDSTFKDISFTTHSGGGLLRTVTVTFTIDSMLSSATTINFTFDYITSHDLDLIKYISTRYYFNMLKMSTCDIYLNCIESNDIVSNISSRLKDGIRLWDTSHGEICDFTFDNVERSYL